MHSLVRFENKNIFLTLKKLLYVAYYNAGFVVLIWKVLRFGSSSRSEADINAVLKTVRLDIMTPKELATIVYPSGLFEPGVLFQAIGSGYKDRKYRASLGGWTSSFF
jgi:hypothetical protein